MKYSLFCLLILASSKLFSQTSTDSLAIVQLLKNDYKTLETFDIAKHIANCTPDYLLIEDGEIWNLQKEIEYFKSNANRRIVRKDQFTIHTFRLSGNVAYLIYELKSEINENGKISAKNWTESAVFRKSTGKWKIAMIHSTTIAAKFPGMK